MQGSGFEALVIYHHTLTAINQLREPLHDEVRATVFRVEGDKLTPVEPEFQNRVLRSQFYPIKSADRRDGWVKTLRAHWYRHHDELKSYGDAQQAEWAGVFEGRAKIALKRESDDTAASYKHRLAELKNRSRDKELEKLALRLQEEEQESLMNLFEEIREDAKAKATNIEDQMQILRQDVERTRITLEAEQKRRLKEVLPNRFSIREVRVLPLAVMFVVPTTAEDIGGLGLEGRG